MLQMVAAMQALSTSRRPQNTINVAHTTGGAFLSEILNQKYTHPEQYTLKSRNRQKVYRIRDDNVVSCDGPVLYAVHLLPIAIFQYILSRVCIFLVQDSDQN